MILSESEIINLTPMLLGRPILVYEGGKKIVGYVCTVVINDHYVEFNYTINRTGEEASIGFASDYGTAWVEDELLKISVPMIGTAEVRMNHPSGG